MKFREMAALVPLLVFVFWIGLYPQYFLQRIAPAVDGLADNAGARFDAVYGEQAEQVADQSPDAAPEDNIPSAKNDGDALNSTDDEVVQSLSFFMNSQR